MNIDIGFVESNTVVVKQRFGVRYSSERKLAAVSLRRQGKSLSEISSSLLISKSTASLWCSEIELTISQRYQLSLRSYGHKLGAEANRIKRLHQIEQIKAAAKLEISKPSINSFWMAGAMLYWAEGSKTHFLGISNSDPRMIVFMVKWFETFLQINPKLLKAQMHLHITQDETKIKKYWSKLTGIPLKNFTKTYFKPDGGAHRKNRLYFGTIRISYNSRDSLHRVLAWIEKYYEYIMTKNYAPLAQSVRASAS